MKQRFRAIALLVIASGVGCQGPEPATSADAAEIAPTWTADIAALVHEHCGNCHTDGGGAPFPLETHAQVAATADLVRFVVGTRRMPPWPAESSGECRTYTDDRWLSDEQIALLQGWIDNGAPRGTGPTPDFQPPPAPAFVASARVEAPAPYTVMPGPDDYRCFVVDPDLDSDRYFTALSVVFDRREVVHHIQLYALDTPDDIEWAQLEDARDQAPGFPCFSVGRGTYLEVLSQGDTVRRYPPGVGQRLEADTALLYQIHYHPATTPMTDRTAVELELVDEVARPATVRSFANYPLELAPGQERVSVSDAHPLYLGDMEAIGVRLHMHTLGVDGRITIDRDGDPTCALHVPRWNFDWQSFYYFDEPIPITNGDDLQLTCSYDTRSRDSYTTWGVSADDEMCLGYLLIAEPG